MDDATKTDIVETIQDLVTALRNARRPNIPYRDAQAIQKGERLIATLTTREEGKRSGAALKTSDTPGQKGKALRSTAAPVVRK